MLKVGEQKTQKASIGVITRFIPPSKNGFILQEVEIEYKLGKETENIKYTECWSVSKGKITLEGDDHILVPKDPEEEGHLNFKLTAWFLPKTKELSMKPMGLKRKAVESAGELYAKLGTIDPEYKRTPSVIRTVNSKWKGGQKPSFNYKIKKNG